MNLKPPPWVSVDLRGGHFWWVSGPLSWSSQLDSVEYPRAVYRSSEASDSLRAGQRNSEESRRLFCQLGLMAGPRHSFRSFKMSSSVAGSLHMHGTSSVSARLMMQSWVRRILLLPPLSCQCAVQLPPC